MNSSLVEHQKIRDIFEISNTLNTFYEICRYHSKTGFVDFVHYILKSNIFFFRNEGDTNTHVHAYKFQGGQTKRS